MRPLKLTDEKIKRWKIPQKVLDPCIVERGDGFVRLDGDSACWAVIRDKYLLKAGDKARPKPLNQGPGTELEAMLRLIFDDGGCWECFLRAAQMNAWGVAGCIEHRAEIIGWLTAAAKERGWGAILAAGAKAAKLGLPLTIGGLVDEAIRRTRVKESNPE